MADLNRGFADAVRRFLHQGPGTALSEEKKKILTSLACGMHEALLLFKIMKSFPENAFPLTLKCILLSASTVTQMIGAMNLQDYTFLQRQQANTVASDNSAQELSDLRVELKRMSLSMAHWMTNAPVGDHNVAKRVLEACLNHLGPVITFVDDPMMLALLWAFNDVRSQLASLQSSRETNALTSRLLLVPSGGSLDDTDGWIIPDTPP